ncbi:50S ribosomal protein L32 [bacterium]|nr:50S ribosomal protein L32 [bacterium]
MALPKNKISKSRRDKRRTHDNLTAVNVGECSHCHQPKLSHRACPNCGYYAGRLVAVPEER